MLRPRSLDANPCLVGFNGKNFLVITASQTMYVVLRMDGIGREEQGRLNRAIALAKRLAAQLSRKKY